METNPPERGAPVALAELDNDNLRAFLALKVAPAQEDLVAPNAVSVAQAYFNPQAWFRGITAGGVPVGFGMLEDYTLVPDRSPKHPIDTIWLWRFMIDARFQKLGFGRQALALFVDQARRRLPGGWMNTSYVPAENSAGPFYVGFGFAETGEVDGTERVLRMKL